MQTWTRDELRDLFKGQLECLDSFKANSVAASTVRALMDLLLDLKTVEEVACTCIANLDCSKDAATEFALKLFR